MSIQAVIRFVWPSVVVALVACGSADIGSSPCGADTSLCEDADGGPHPVADAPPTGADPDAPGTGGTVDALPMIDADCPSVIVEVKAVIPTVSLVIDRSFSMTTAFGKTDRWTAEETALVDATNGVVTKLASRVRFGATMYTTGHLDDQNPDVLTCPLLRSASTEPALDNYGAIKSLFEMYEPRGDTPTGESLVEVTAALDAVEPLDPDNPEPKFIVLSTDGEPDTCAHPNPENPEQAEEARQVSIDAVKAAFDKNITTFVLSVGDDVGADHLQDLANAGAGKPIDDGNPNNDAAFIVATNPDELVTAFDSVLSQVVKSCTFNLDGDILPGRQASGDVRLDGMQLDFGDDWDVVDSNTIELVGGACDTYLGDPDAVISAEFPCGAIDPE